MEVRLVTFGKPALWVGGAQKQLREEYLALLAYLWIETRAGKRHTLDELRNLLWRGVDRKSTVVSKALSELRDALGEEFGTLVLPPHKRQIALQAMLDCDAGDLLKARAEAKERRAALNAYHGPFLNGLELGAAEEGYGRWREWLDVQRGRFEQLYLELSREECEDLLAEQQWRDLLTLAQHALDQVPSWEAGGQYVQKAKEGIARAESAERERRQRIQAIPPATAERVAAEEIEASPNPGLPDRPQFFSRRSLGYSCTLALVAVILALFLLNPSMRTNVDFRTGVPQGFRATAPLCAPGKARAHRFDQDYKPNVENIMAPGERFSTAWYLQNTGDCTWDARFRIHKVRNTSSHPLTLNNVRDVFVGRPIGPGDTIMLRAAQAAPEVEGRFGEDWELLDAAGKRVALDDGEPLRARIRVQITAPVCDRDSVRAEMVGTNYLDNAVFRPGESLTYTWTVMNRTKSTCALDPRYVLRFGSAPNGRLSNPRKSTIRIEERVLPSYGYTFEVGMRAPAEPGTYVEEWYLTDTSGNPIPLEKGTKTTAVITVSPDAVKTPRARICGPGEAKAGWWRSERILDGTLIPEGQEFTKKWTIPNTGSCMWGPGTHMHYAWVHGGGPLSVSQKEIYFTRPVPPHTTYTVDVPMIARAPSGKRGEYWSLHDAEHRLIMVSQTKAVGVEIVVIPEGGER